MLLLMSTIQVNILYSLHFSALFLKSDKIFAYIFWLFRCISIQLELPPTQISPTPPTPLPTLPKDNDLEKNKKIMKSLKFFTTPTLLLLIFLSYNIVTAKDDRRINYVGCMDFGYSLFPEYKGLKMHIRCYPNPNSKKLSKPNVIFDSGMPFSSLVFADVIEQLIPSLPNINVGNVCFFDRYGYGYSDPSPYAMMSNETAHRLHESLRIAKLYPPYILAGWSWGSIDMQFFAMKYMRDVVGLLTVEGTDYQYSMDTTNPQKLASSTAYAQQFLYLANNDLIKNATSHGDIPLEFGFLPNNTDLPPTVVEKSNDFFCSSKFFTTVIQELQIMLPSASLLGIQYDSMNTTTPLSNIPFVVLTAEQNDNNWIERQSIMASLSTTHEHLMVNTTHFVPLENPKSVVDSLKILVNNHSSKEESSSIILFSFLN
ncbi:hypothetical protein PPL_03420 [Heterostelium album PN500]|uniref:AB hydrolase-1 domain-containing protein n=1 Tax=Heterostelium pallidum (strain ATCC 26659 / Pp 5 / PN500) TaxID=670386 RepID=D3B4U4_HETP5|nr:hypothetical protein PPL_03420 [Heterostelium album PN500]EFA84342.1 hypothetical protein PPL_03420 [Heterostelium album PN500]|eukprot:XP_020436457.1 hypothetical protein PPL_03420 [Heterostelium album PN500]